MAPKGRSAASSTPSAAAESEASEPIAPAGEIAAVARGGEERRKMATSKEAGGSRQVPAGRGSSSSVPGKSGASAPSSGRAVGAAMTGKVEKSPSLGGGMAAATTAGEKSTSLRRQGTASSSPRAGMEVAVPGREKASSLRGQAAPSSPGAGMVSRGENPSSLEDQGGVSSSPGSSPATAEATGAAQEQGRGKGVAAEQGHGKSSSLGDQGGVSSSPGSSPATAKATGAAQEQGRGKGVAAEQGHGKSSSVPASSPSSGYGRQAESSRAGVGGGRASSSGRYGESSRAGAGRGRASSSGRHGVGGQGRGKLLYVRPLGWSEEAVPQHARCCVGRILTMRSEVDLKSLQSKDSRLSWINSSGICALFAKGYAVTVRHCVTDEDTDEDHNTEGGQQVSNERVEKAVSNNEEEVWVAYFPCYNSAGKPRARAFRFHVVKEDADLDVAILYLEGCNNTVYMQPITNLMQDQLLGKKVSTQITFMEILQRD
ncbi:hypothetical protein SELMODRAFT_405465 [Selaginella moellendorffii]|uniref:Uncharacterized protein n=1 Tax=Selaginella moellendorffii TaxID=88036 RepID=D8QYN5_SELML|nr:hypothetical protein SELMODRAFT_405465 [Selaginella moellendorffii]